MFLSNFYSYFKINNEDNILYSLTNKTYPAVDLNVVQYDN